MGYAKNKETYLTKDQARHIYKKVELEGTINVDTIKQVIGEEKLGRYNIDDDEVNPYHNIFINNLDKEKVSTSQMEQWSILSNIVKYVQYDRNPKMFYELNVKAIDQKNHRKMYDKLKDDDRQILELNYGDNPDKLRGEYLEVFEGVQSEVLDTTRFNKKSSLSLTSLGRTDMTRASKIKAEAKSFISEQGKIIRWHQM